MNWYSKTADETLIGLNSDINQGLSEEEAKKRLAENGENVIEGSGKRKGFIRKFFEQLNDIMIIILLAASAASFGVSWLKGEADFTDSVIIIMIVVINAVLGVIQENKAEKAIEELKKMTVPHAKVVREGKIKEIPSADVVTGDILVLEAGDMVCADARLLTSADLKADESSLTGESVPVSKSHLAVLNEKTPLAERKNMIFSSTYITGGRCRAVVCDTAMNTEVGKIASMIETEQKSETPLQKRLDSTGKILGAAAIAICAFIFLIGVMRNYEPFDMFMTSISLAVAAIPEGLPAIVTIVLAIGMQTMSKKNTIVRTLPAVETLGSAQVICTDKTGTLTKNKMKVVKICSDEEETSLNDKRFILRLAALCTDCYFEDRHFVGDPTETAIAEAAEEMDERKARLEAIMPRIDEIAFSSERKMMTTVHDFGNGHNLCITKGAPERVIKLCSHYSGGKRIDANAVRKLMALNDEMTSSALRVLALAYKEADKGVKNYENNLIFAGFIGIMDPPREEVYDAVNECRRAGIKVVMITGDNKLTAKAVAEKTGIYKDGDRICDGDELDSMTDTQLSDVLERITVFARVSPEHKLKIVNAYKKKAEYVQ